MDHALTSIPYKDSRNTSGQFQNGLNFNLSRVCHNAQACEHNYVFTIVDFITVIIDIVIDSIIHIFLDIAIDIII